MRLRHQQRVALGEGHQAGRSGEDQSLRAEFYQCGPVVQPAAPALEALRFLVMAYPAAVSSTLPDSDGPFHSQLGTLVRVRRRALHAVRRRRLEFVPLVQENED